MKWFIKSAEGTYYAGGPDEAPHWSLSRRGAVVFDSEGAALDRIDELGIQDASPEEY